MATPKRKKTKKNKTAKSKKKVVKKKKPVKKAAKKKSVKKKSSKKKVKKTAAKKAKKKKATKKSAKKKKSSKKAKSAKKKSAKKKSTKKKPAKKKPTAKKAVKKKTIKKSAKKSVKKKKGQAKPKTKGLPPELAKRLAKNVDIELEGVFTPLDDRLIVKYESTAETTSGGIIIPGTVSHEKPYKGKVLTVGRGHRDKKGRVRPMDVKVGDTVLFARYTGQELSMGSADVLIMREGEILGIMN